MRLLPRMVGVKAQIGIRMKDAKFGEPALCDSHESWPRQRGPPNRDSNLPQSDFWGVSGRLSGQRAKARGFAQE